MKGLSGSGNVSGIIAVGSGPLRKNKNKTVKKKGKKEWELFIEKIDHLYIGFLPLISNTMHKFTNAIVGFRKIFPTFLFAKRWVHACVFLATKEMSNENYDGILLEYGAYIKDCDDYEREVFFINGENGMRYTEMTLEEFKTRMIELNSESGNIPFIKCNVNSINLFNNLIERTIYGEEYAKNPNLFAPLFRLNDEKLNEKYLHSYNGKNYDLIKFNCQCFVTKIIEASYATIAPFVMQTVINNRLCYINLKIDYENMKYYIPPNIVEALERNKKLIDQRLKEGKTRIVENNIKSFINPHNFMESLFEMDKINGETKENEWKKKSKEEKDIILNRFNTNAAKLLGLMDKK